MKRYIYLLLTIVWMAIIFWFSAATAADSGGYSQGVTEKILALLGIDISPMDIDRLESFIRKVAHFTEYFILGIFAYKTAQSFWMKRNICLAVILFCFLYALSDEIHQYFVPGRACRIFDIFIDTMGSAISCFCLKRIYKARELA